MVKVTIKWSYKQYINAILYYYKIDDSEDRDVNETITFKNVFFVTIGIFLDKGFKFQSWFKFQSCVCNGCRDYQWCLLTLSVLLF